MNLLDLQKTKYMRRLSIILLIGIGAVSCNQEKTAYVENEKVVEEYYKLENMRNKYNSKQEALKKEIDSLTAPFQKLYQEYMEKRESLEDGERQQREQQLRQMQQQIRAKQNQQGRQIQQQRGKESDSLIKVMENKIAEYAEQKGYTYIFGSNQSSNILYGDKSKNITDDVIDMLNEDAGKSKKKEDQASSKEE